MVKIEILAVGKDKDSWVTDGIDHYKKLLGKFARVSWIAVAAERKKSLSPAQIRVGEAGRILARIAGGLVIALDDSGTTADSPQLARKLEQWLGRCGGRITFIVGGAYGLDESVLERADIRLSLSRLTFSHQVVRLVLLEQLFRAFSILHGSDYHK